MTRPIRPSSKPNAAQKHAEAILGHDKVRLPLDITHDDHRMIQEEARHAVIPLADQGTRPTPSMKHFLLWLVKEHRKDRLAREGAEGAVS